VKGKQYSISKYKHKNYNESIEVLIADTISLGQEAQKCQLVQIYQFLEDNLSNDFSIV
jgi:hypothetical protein